MGLRFRKSIKLSNNLKFNINKDSVSLSAGTKGAHYTINSTGTETTSFSIPGSGISYQRRRNLNSKDNISEYNTDNDGSIEFSDLQLLNQENTNKIYKLPKDVTFRLNYIYFKNKKRSSDWVDLSRSLCKLYALLFLVVGDIIVPSLCLTPQIRKIVFSNNFSLSVIICIMVLCTIIGIYFIIKWIDYRDILLKYQNYCNVISNILKEQNIE